MTTVILNLSLKEGQRGPALERDLNDLCRKYGLKLKHDKSRIGISYYSAAPEYVPSTVTSLDEYRFAHYFPRNTPPSAA